MIWESPSPLCDPRAKFSKSRVIVRVCVCVSVLSNVVCVWKCTSCSADEYAKLAIFGWKWMKHSTKWNSLARKISLRWLFLKKVIYFVSNFGNVAQTGAAFSSPVTCVSFIRVRDADESTDFVRFLPNCSCILRIDFFPFQSNFGGEICFKKRKSHWSVVIDLLRFGKEQGRWRPGVLPVQFTTLLITKQVARAAAR